MYVVPFCHDRDLELFAWIHTAEIRAARCLACLFAIGHTTVMFLPSAGIVLVGADTDRRTTMLRTATFVLLSSAVFLTLQFVFIKPNQSPELVAYWYLQNAFPPNGNANYKFYIHAFREAFYMFYFGSRFLPRPLVCWQSFHQLTVKIQNARSKALLASLGCPIVVLLALNRFLLPVLCRIKTLHVSCLAVLVVWGATKIAKLLTK
jgi:hypothetical protein